MSKRRKSGVGQRDELRKRLDRAMTKEPGLMREVVKEALDREEKANVPQPPDESTESPQTPPSPPQIVYKAEVVAQKIPVANPETGGRLQQFLAQSEVEALVLEGGQWFLIRRRALAQEVKANEDGGSGGTGGSVPGDSDTKAEIPVDGNNDGNGSGKDTDPDKQPS
jgi:hypothetical protein